MLPGFDTAWYACSYGATSDGKLVDSAGLQLLESMGFERALAAEALKQVQQPIIPALLCPCFLALALHTHRHACGCQACKACIVSKLVTEMLHSLMQITVCSMCYITAYDLSMPALACTAAMRFPGLYVCFCISCSQGQPASIGYDVAAEQQ